MLTELNIKNAKCFCREDISLIENYEEALTSPDKYVVHHRREITENKTQEELIEERRYYNCPASELIWLSRSEHTTLHFKGRSVSDSTREKLRNANIGKKMPDETKLKKAETMRQKYLDGYVNPMKGKPSPMKGKHQTEESNRKNAESHKGRIPWNKGKTGIYSDEARKKMSECNKGRHHTEEFKKKISEINKGKRVSDETKRKISESQKQRWSKRLDSEKCK